MFYVAWWTGRGYSTILIVVASLILLELLTRALNLPDGLWVLGFALLSAAAVNWVIGRKLNRQSLAKVRSHRIRERLICRARHKFISFPMETFSVVIAFTGAVMLGVAVVK